jgi:hypothetical protein
MLKETTSSNIIKTLIKSIRKKRKYTRYFLALIQLCIISIKNYIRIILGTIT